MHHQHKTMPGNYPEPSTIAVEPRPASYDSQVETYDRRAGLPEVACRQIAQAVLAIGNAESGGWVLEVGTGTGQIGQWFAQCPVQYLGFDLSQPMLAAFQRRLDPNQDNLSLIQADGNQPWPIDEGMARIVLSSRAIHLLDLDWVVREVFRVARPDGAVLLLGRVQRQRHSVRSQMQQQLQQLLRQRGYSPRQGKRYQQQLIERCCQLGATLLDPVDIACWTVSTTPWQSLETWHQKAGLAGIDLPATIKQEILQEVQQQAEHSLSDLHQPIESEETYVLQGVRLTAAA